MDDQNKNLILATVLSLMVIIVWTVISPPPQPPQQQETEQATAADGTPQATAPTTADDAQLSESTGVTDPTDDTPRVAIDTPRLNGSISLLGGRIDELFLKDYRVTNDPGSPIVQMLSPAGTTDAYYTLYGWAAGSGLTPEDVPGPNTVWTLASGSDLTPDSPITLAWENPAGLTFTRTISVDDEYMFTVTQSIANNSGNAISAAPYGILARHGEPSDLRNFFILHEGAIQMADGELLETDWDDFAPSGELEDVAVENGGWAGFTDHYWMSVLIPSNEGAFKISTFHDPRRDIYQTTAKLPTVQVATGDSYSATTQLFAGAKEWEQIRAYERTGVEGFIDSIDWGWFFFLTKPIFWLLHELNKLIGNMGWAIIGLTLVIKMVLLPLAFKSYVSMAKMKELQPEMEKLKEAAGDDRQKLQQGMMELYKKEKVNPAAGCLPILLQIPIFFSLYKVIFVTIELRHAPWFGPFQDLSAPDPTSFINLFGLLPFAGPAPESILSFILIGILPLLLGISMWLQQKLNPAPTDPTQQMIFAWMPWVFMFMLGGFASGLVVYWITNNVITFVQQYMIMRSQGYTPDVFGNIKAGFNRKVAEAKAEKPEKKPTKK
jgi:YidC/Oxa1 family membrane protein insertase